MKTHNIEENLTKALTCTQGAGTYTQSEEGENGELELEEGEASHIASEAALFAADLSNYNSAKA